MSKSSKKYRLLFYREFSGWNIFVGTLTAKFEKEIGEWVLFKNLLFYLKQKEINKSDIDRKTYEEKVVASLQDTAKEFEPLVKQIIEIFCFSERLAQWKPNYDQLIHEETQRRYYPKNAKS